MSARKQQNQINLLPIKGFEQTTGGRILAWILSTFRIIVIVTEIIVMIAFLSRFWLDAQNTDLSDEIEDKKAVLIAYTTFENDFKATQRKLAFFSQLIGPGSVVADSLSTTVSFLPDNIALSSYGYSSSGLTLNGSSFDEVSIQQLIVNLVSSGKIEDVNLTQLQTDPKNPSILNFSISGKLSSKGK